MKFLSAEVKRVNDEIRESAAFDPADAPDYVDLVNLADDLTEHDDRIFWASTVFPFAAFAGIIPLAFSALEQMMTDLVEVAEVSQVVSFETFRSKSKDPQLTAQMSYLREVAGWGIEWGKADRREFGAAVALRNKVVHTFGIDISTDTFDSLNISSRGADANFVWTHETLMQLMAIIGRFAQAVADASPSGPRELRGDETNV